MIIERIFHWPGESGRLTWNWHGDRGNKQKCEWWGREPEAEVKMMSVKERWTGPPGRLRDNSRTRFNKTAYVQHHQNRRWYLGNGTLIISKLKLGANLSIDHSRKPCTWLNVWLWSGYKSLILYLHVVGCSSLLNLKISSAKLLIF